MLAFFPLGVRQRHNVTLHNLVRAFYHVDIEKFRNIWPEKSPHWDCDTTYAIRGSRIFGAFGSRTPFYLKSFRLRKMARDRPRYYTVKPSGLGFWQPSQKMRALGFESVACGSDGPEAWALAESWNSKWDEIRHDADAKKATQQLRRDLSQLFAEIRDLGRRVQHDIVAAAALAEGLRGCAHSIEVDLAALSKPDSQTQLPDIDWNGTTSEVPKSETTDRERATESESDAKSEQSNSDVTTSRNANGASATALNGSKHQASQNWVLWFSDFPTEESELGSARSIET